MIKKCKICGREFEAERAAMYCNSEECLAARASKRKENYKDYYNKIKNGERMESEPAPKCWKVSFKLLGLEWFWFAKNDKGKELSWGGFPKRSLAEADFRKAVSERLTI